MVRVISVHHFISQNVQTVEQPTAITTVPPDKLLLALMSNCVEVRNLENNAEVLFTFPTVDEVIQICYSLNGDYVATLETKFNRQNKEVNFVRIYLNWNSIATLQQSKMTSNGVSLGLSECGMVQPMRARIAGRVTPTSNQSEVDSLEMIEIPLGNENNPSCIAVCAMTGNILILSGHVLSFYKFEVRSHDISKMKFIDFKDTGMSVQLTFSPSKIEIAENYVCAMNSTCLHLFKIGKKCGKSEKKNSLEFPFQNSSASFDFESVKNNDEFTINLPSISRENSLVHKHCPFMSHDKEMHASISSCNSNEKYRILDLITYRLTPISIENAQRHINEEFKTFVLKTLYVDEVLNASKINNSDNILRGEFSKCLNSITCMVATSQEGYLFFLNDSDEKCEDKCIGVYPFTAPVYQLVMEDYFLHALTETGLESYTLRFARKLCHNFGNIDNVNMACPTVDEGVCLVGLRPFLGVEQMILSQNNLLLLANADVSPTHSVGSNSSSNAVYWTLYSLELPSPSTIFDDISIVANVHKFTSVKTYRHLMNEAHMILRTVLLLKKFATCKELNESVRLVVGKRNENLDNVVDLFRNSCALLADHFVMCREQYRLAVPYYKMAGIRVSDVFKRVRKLQEKSENSFVKGLLFYTKHAMLDLKKGQEIDKLFAPSFKQNFMDNLLSLLELDGFEDLPTFILKNRILQEYSTDKLITILTENLKKDSPEKYIALSLLHIRKNNPSEAERCLDVIEKSDELFVLISENYPEILFENMTSFSELAEFLIKHRTEKFSKTLVSLVMKKKFLNFGKLIRIFLEYLPVSIDDKQNRSACFLQMTLENYFEDYFKSSENLQRWKIVQEKSVNEGLKLLARSYLAQLQILQFKNEKINEENDENEEETAENSDNILFEDKRNEDETTYLFSKFRYKYLDKMPPFQVEIVSKMMSLENETFPANHEADSVLRKLQAILCSPMISKNITNEIDAFLSLNPDLRGASSLKTLILTNQNCVEFLIKSCPQCLLHFGKDRFNSNEEWKFLIEQLQLKISNLYGDERMKRICFFFKKILRDVSNFVATSKTIDELKMILSKKSSEMNVDGWKLESMEEIRDYEPYYEICKETLHANQMRKLIVTTGQQLLSTLDL